MEIYQTVNYRGDIDFKDKLSKLSVENITGVRCNLSKFPIWKLEKILVEICSAFFEICIGMKLLLDFPFPGKKLRVLDFNFDGNIKRNYRYHLVKSENLKKDINNCIFVDDDFISWISLGDIIYYGDGDGAFTVTKKGYNFVEICSLANFVMISQKSLSIKVEVDIEKSNCLLRILKEIPSERLVLFLSFVEGESDLRYIREKLGSDYKIISKIETSKAVLNLEDILLVSDGVAVARGDLALFSDYTMLYFYQKDIIECALEYEKEIYCATDILTSMNQFYFPNRADIIDISHLINLGCDRFVLRDGTKNISRVVDLIENMYKRSKMSQYFRL